MCGGLFKSIQRFPEKAHVILFAGYLKSFRLFNVDCFVEFAVEEGRIDVHLVDLVVFTTSEECEESADRRVLGDGCESFVVVFPPSLGETFGAKTSLVEVVDVLDLENPTRFDDFRILGARDESPSIILHNGVVFLLHGDLPLFCIRCLHGLIIISWPFPIPLDSGLECFGDQASGAPSWRLWWSGGRCRFGRRCWRTR